MEDIWTLLKRDSVNTKDFDEDKPEFKWLLGEAVDLSENLFTLLVHIVLFSITGGEFLQN